MKNKIVLLVVAICFGVRHVDGSPEIKQPEVQQKSGVLAKIWDILGVLGSSTNHYVDQGKGEVALGQLDQVNKVNENLAEMVKEQIKLSEHILDANGKAIPQGNATTPSNGGSQGLQSSLQSQMSYFDATYKGLGILSRTITIVGAGYNFYNWAFPSEDAIQQVKILRKERDRRLAVLVAEDLLNKCLGKHMKTTKKDDEGMPCRCENEMREFAMAAGFNELNKVKAAFNQKYKPENK